METGLSIIGDVLTPEQTVGLVQQIQEFLAQNGEIVMLIIGTMINYMVKPLFQKFGIGTRLMPYATFLICIGVFLLLNDTWTWKSLIFGGLYLWVIVTLQYLQDKSAVEKKMLDELTLPKPI